MTRISNIVNFEQGLSLLEMCIYLAILSLFLYSASPYTANMESDRLVSSEARELALNIESWITNSIQQEENVEVTINIDRYHARSEHGSINFTKILHKDVQAELPNDHEQVIRLYRSGTASPAMIRLLRNTKRCDIIISLRGRVRTSC